jgi:hypothetical protein
VKVTPDARTIGLTVLLGLAFCAAATPILIGIFDSDRLWHEGVGGFFVAVVCATAVAVSERPTWQRRTARVLLVLAGLTVLAVIALGVVVLIAWGTQRDS